MASDRVRYVGECVAICVAPSRAEAEDIVQQISLDIEELGRRGRARSRPG